MTCVRHGGYAAPEHRGAILEAWKKNNPKIAIYVEELIQRYLRELGWDAGHDRFNEVRDVAIMAVSRSALFMKILEVDFTRDVNNPKTGEVIYQRPADEFRRLEELDIEIQERLHALGLLKSRVINKRRQNK